MFFWPSVVHSVVFQQQFSFLSAVMNHVAVVVDPVFVSLLVLVVTLNGRPRDSVDPRLLNFHLLSCGDERGGVRSRDLGLSSLLERPLCSADGGGPTDGDE